MSMDGLKSKKMKRMIEIDGIMRDEDHAESELGIGLAKNMSTSTPHLL